MLIIFGILTCLMITVIITDITRFIIPNWLVLAVFLLYPVAVYMAPHTPNWQLACLISLCAFIIGYGMFAFGLMGGGDIKLLTVVMLYTGKFGSLPFLLYMAVLGGFGTLILLGLRMIAPSIYIKLGKSAADMPRVLLDKEPAPYGVAIAIAFLILLWHNQLPGLVLKLN